MAKILKGNYRLSKERNLSTRRKRKKKDLTDDFERNVLAKLGGSLCFVMKKNNLLWTDEKSEKVGKKDR